MKTKILPLLTALAIALGIFAAPSPTHAVGNCWPGAFTACYKFTSGTVTKPAGVTTLIFQTAPTAYNVNVVKIANTLGYTFYNPLVYPNHIFNYNVGSAQANYELTISISCGDFPNGASMIVYVYDQNWNQLFYWSINAQQGTCQND